MSSITDANKRPFFHSSMTQIRLFRCILCEPVVYRSQSLGPADDDVLIDQIRQGRTEALGVLFDRYYRLVFTVASRVLGNDTEAEDVIQEVFIEIYRKADLYDPGKGSVKVWLLQ